MDEAPTGGGWLHEITIVARGTLISDEVRSTAQRLPEARVRRFAKIVEVAGAHLALAPADIAQLAQTLRGDPDSRGPIAFVVAANRGAFARQFAAATAHEGRSMFSIACMMRARGLLGFGRPAPKQ